MTTQLNTYRLQGVYDEKYPRPMDYCITDNNGLMKKEMDMVNGLLTNYIMTEFGILEIELMKCHLNDWQHFS